MLLVVTGPTDATAEIVIGKLRARGADVHRFNPGDFPSRASVSLGFDSRGRTTATLRTPQARIDLRAVDAIWFRRPDPPRADARVDDGRVRRYIADECALHLNDVWNTLACDCLPARPWLVAHAELKASQLALASALGFEIPSTLITTEPADFLGFHRAHDGSVVSKPAGPAFNRHFAPEIGRYTELVSPRDVAYADSVRHAPTIFQAYVCKRIELRVTVVGERVFAAEIHSQTARRTRHDWRRYDLAHTPHRPHALPPEIARRCVLLVQRLGLAYGAIDLILTPAGRYVFLEINPNGQFLWIEQLTSLAISDAIADWLAARESTTRVEAGTRVLAATETLA